MGNWLNRRTLLIFVASTIGYAVWHGGLGEKSLITESIACGGLEVEVLGLLVHAETGEPLQGVTVRVLPTMDVDFTAERFADFADFQSMALQDPQRPAGSRSWATTSAEGAFRLRVWVAWSWTYRNDVLQGEERPPARSGVGGLLLLTSGGGRQLVPVSPETGTWQAEPQGNEPTTGEIDPLWARWDLGRIRITPPK